jgi:ribokinase
VLAAARLGRAAGALVVLNAAAAMPLPADLLSLVDALVVNRTEATALGGAAAPAQAAKLASAAAVAVTRPGAQSSPSGAEVEELLRTLEA